MPSNAALREISRSASFVLVPVVSAVSPLVALPAIADQYGAAGWSDVAIGLAAGGTGAVFAELGWGVIGPQRVAGDPAGRRTLYSRSLASRLVAVAVIAPLAALAAAVLAQTAPVAASLCAVALVLATLTPSWYLVGVNRPELILLVDSLPRAVCVLGGALLIAGGGPLEAYGCGLFIAAVTTVVLAGTVPGLPHWPSGADFRASLRVVLDQRVLVAGRAVTVCTTTVPTILLGLVAPGAVPVYAAVDRPLRMGLGVATAVPTRLQSWVGAALESQRSARLRSALLVNVTLGVASAAAVLVAMPVAVPVLFSGEVIADSAVVGWAAALALLVCCNRGGGLTLVALGEASWIAIAAVVAAAVALPSIAFLTPSSGAVGTMAALVVAEAAAGGVQFARCARRWPRGGTR